jgi:hypothetical protein
VNDDEKALADYERSLSEALGKMLAETPKESFTEQGRRLAMEELRRRPWERDERGLVWRYELDGCQYEDRWDGESLTIDRVVTFPAHAERITVDIDIADEDES